MAVNDPLNRVLLFRLTQGQYDSLRAASSEKGARSLSDFARTKLLHSIEQPTIDSQISELKQQVDRIAELLEKR